MRRTRIFCGIGGLIALLGISAACQGYQQSAPAPAPAYSATPPPVDPLDQKQAVSTPPSAKPIGVDDLLDKLEALKAKREAIEREEKATHALLKAKIKVQQERMGKLGVGNPGPDVQPPPNIYPQ